MQCSGWPKLGNVDVISGDWLSEINIVIIKRENPEIVREVGFLEQLSESIDTIADKKIKIVTGAGALDTAALTRKVEALCMSRGLDSAVIASMYGNDVIGQVLRAREDGVLNFPHLDREMLLKNWNLDLASAVTIHPPPKTASYPVESPSEETSAPVALDIFGPTERASLGSIVHARSGVKGM